MPRTKAGAIRRLEVARQQAGQPDKLSVERTVKPDADAVAKGSKPRRWRPGTIARREIRRYQKSTKALLPKRPVRHIVKALLHKHSQCGDMRMTRNAFTHLHEMSSVVLSEVLAAAERVRALEHGVKAIHARHMQVGRGLVGMHALSCAQLPIERSAVVRPTAPEE